MPKVPYGRSPSYSSQYLWVTGPNQCKALLQYLGLGGRHWAALGYRLMAKPTDLTFVGVTVLGHTVD